MNHRVLIAACVLLGAVSAASSAATRPPLPFKHLIIGAIDSPTGTMKETFGPDVQWVKLFRQRIGTDGPITVTSRVVKRWKQEGCAGVETEFLFHKARFDDAKRDFKDEGFTMFTNTCRDGQPPVESMDLRALKDTMSDQPDPAQSTVNRLTMPPRDTARLPTLVPEKK